MIVIGLGYPKWWNLVGGTIKRWMNWVRVIPPLTVESNFSGIPFRWDDHTVTTIYCTIYLDHGTTKYTYLDIYIFMYIYIYIYRYFYTLYFDAYILIYLHICIFVFLYYIYTCLVSITIIISISISVSISTYLCVYIHTCISKPIGTVRYGNPNLYLNNGTSPPTQENMSQVSDCF